MIIIIKKNSQILKINELIKDYFFIKQNELITINHECVKLWDIRKNEQSSSILNINKITQKYIYDSNLNYLYLINQRIQIVDLNKFKLMDNIYNDDTIVNPISSKVL